MSNLRSLRSVGQVVMSLSVVALIAVLAGCTTEPRLPRIGDSRGSTPTVKSDRALEDLRSCLVEARLPAVIVTNGDVPVLGWDQSRRVAWRTPGGVFDMTEAMRSGDLSADEEAFLRNIDGGPGLVVDGVDESDKYLACVDSSGYVDSAPLIDATTELAMKTSVAQRSLVWARCARDNGFPTVRDPDAPVADNLRTYPTVALPADITEEELLQLLQACPPVSPDDVEAWQTSTPGGSAAEAAFTSIGFDVPGFDGRGATAPTRGVDIAKYRRLKTLILQQIDEQLNGHSPRP